MGRTTNRYQEIIIESAKLFRERGYLATSIRDIGDALGVTSAALYYHFKNKDELLQAVITQSIQTVTAAVEEAIKVTDEPGQKLLVAMQTHLEISTKYQDFAIVVLQEARHLSPEAYKIVVGERDKYDALWNELFYRAKAEGLYRDIIDLRLVRLLMFGAMNLVVTWYKPDGAYQPRQIAEALFYYASEGMRNPEIEPLLPFDSMPLGM